MASTVLSTLGLSLDILGVLLLFVFTSSRFLESEFAVRLVETNWITMGDGPEQNERWLVEAKKQTEVIRRIQRAALTIIGLGFLLQLIGHFV